MFRYFPVLSAARRQQGPPFDSVRVLKSHPTMERLLPDVVDRLMMLLSVLVQALPVGTNQGRRQVLLTT